VKIPDSKSASFLQKNHFIMIISSESSTNKIISQNGSSDQRIRRNTCSTLHAYGGGAHLVRALLRTLSVRYVEGQGSSESMIRLVAGAELGDSSSRT
jgi:hypothetical protein